MDHFAYHDGVLHAEDVAMPAIAEAVGTPVYVYSSATLRRHARVFRDALVPLGDPLIAYSVKANPNLAVLGALAREGYGADVVSGGELERALAAGIAPSDIVFSGVGKRADELALGLERGIGQFNVESAEEARELSAIAVSRDTRAVCALRVNPDIDAGTHDKISTGRADNKFGVPHGAGSGNLYRDGRVCPGSRRAGSRSISAASLPTWRRSNAPLRLPRRSGHATAARCDGHTITHVDLGGGLGVPYWQGEILPSPAKYGAMVARATAGWDVRLIFEPGRVIVGNAGVLLTRVIRVKRGTADPFIVVDAAMNDLARPALYGAHHDIAAVAPTGERTTANVVGPICETGDTFATAREMDALEAGDLAVFRTAGAYGATMASSYNSRGFVPEVLVHGDRFAVVADRISPGAIMDAERVPEWL